jgi:hypothetical protein
LAALLLSACQGEQPMVIVSEKLDGSENVFTADGEGNASISLEIQPL